MQYTQRMPVRGQDLPANWRAGLRGDSPQLRDCLGPLGPFGPFLPLGPFHCHVSWSALFWPHSHRLKTWLTVLFFCLTGATLPAADPLPSQAELARRVVVLANSDDPDSLRIARHYAAARGVPRENIIALPLPSDETIGWDVFVAGLWDPLLERLVAARWVDAIPMELHDYAGRRKYAVHSHRIAALVVCRGVPLRITHEPRLYGEALPFTRRTEFRTNAGAVDAELALLPMPGYPINAFVPNPLYQDERPAAEDRRRVVLVSRLDGPTAEDAMALVDGAVRAEKRGLRGRAYIDLSERDPLGNEWLEKAGAYAQELGYETIVDRGPEIFPLTTPLRRTAIYLGWYAQDLGGALAAPDFRFEPGAIALHIHSYSATTLRSPTAHWTGPLVARGAAATVGNVWEPYLHYTHRPHLLMKKLAAGATWAEAGYYALQGLSWQGVLIGDPLYRPFPKK